MGKQTDISQQVKRYLDGELDAHAMHELERRAQDDPFLKDALEGYETVPANRDAGLGELQSRLQQRVVKKEARIIPWRIISIAASVLLLLGIGLFWYQHSSSPVMMKVASVQAPVTKPEAVQKEAPIRGDSAMAAANIDKIITAKAKRVTVNRRRTKMHIAADAAVDAAPPAMSDMETVSANAVFKSKDTTPLNEMIVMDYTAKKKTNDLLTEKPISAAADSAFRPSDKNIIALAKIDTNNYKGTIAPIKGTNVATLDGTQDRHNATSMANQYLPGEGYFRNYTAQQGGDMQAIAMRPNLSNSAAKGYVARRVPGNGGLVPFNPVILHGRMVKGMVKESGEPVVNATVKIKGTNISTLTDDKGRFTLYAVPDSAILQVKAEGYMTKETKAARHGLQVISIHEAVNTLNNATSITDIPEDFQARPSTGWDDFDNYLRQNAISPDGKKGMVKLSFKVNADNSLSDFKVVSGISTQTDNAAVKLIKDGPAWYTAADDKPQTITISIKFHARGK